MTSPTTDPAAQVSRERALELAERDLQLIAQLLDSPGWTYLARRLNERRQTLRHQLADDDTLTDPQTRTLRALVKEYDAILNLPAQDRALHQSTLAAAHRVSTGPSRG